VVILFAMWCSGLFLANFLAGHAVQFLRGLSGDSGGRVVLAVYVPYSRPAEWMQHLAALLPLRWGGRAERRSDGRTGPSPLLRSWGIALGLAWLVWAATRWLEGKVHDHIRVTGELNSI
jgi:hypothetical protein